MPDPRLLLVEDDAELQAVVARGLREEGFEVLTTGSGGGAMGHAATPFDAVVMDIGLPDADGRDVCQALRARGVDVPVIFLTARDAVTDRISGFGAGGDDYLVKPFHLGELVARLRALLRRAGGASTIELAGLTLDPVAHELRGALGTQPLTPTEFRLLAALAGRSGDVVRRRELLAAGWPDGAVVHDNTLDQYLARLRRKLAGVCAEPTITTARGVGYRLG